jgi:uncharacterized membrane protein
LTGTLLGLLSALSWSCANVTIKTSTRRFGTFAALFASQIAGGLLVLPVAFAVEGRPGCIDGRTALMIGLAAVSACLAYGGLFAAFRRGPVAVLTPVVSAWTLISVAIGVALFGEALTAGQGVGVVLVLAGNTLLAVFGTRRRPGGEPGGSGGIAAAALSALGFGVMTPAIDAVGESIGALWTVPAVWVVELALFVPLALALGLVRAWPRSVRDWCVVSAPGIFEVIGFVAIVVALGLAPIAAVAPASSLSTALTIVLGMGLLKERMSRPALAGAFLAAAGVVAVNL